MGAFLHPGSRYLTHVRQNPDRKGGAILSIGFRCEMGPSLTVGVLLA